VYHPLQTINLKYAEKDEDMKGLMSHPRNWCCTCDWKWNGNKKYFKGRTH